jgi:hypothetical protein
MNARAVTEMAEAKSKTVEMFEIAIAPPMMRAYRNRVAIR